MKNKAIYNDAPEYCRYYFDLIESDDLLSGFDKSTELTLEVFRSIPPSLENYAYQPNKWTIKEVIRHVIDMERIFAYRAFRFSRLDDTPLSGVEENEYIEKVDLKDVSMDQVKQEYEAIRKSTLWIYQNINEESLNFKGMANGQSYTTKSLGFAMIGHNIHHCHVILSRYLKPK